MKKNLEVAMAISVFVNNVISNFKKVKPDWHPPHKIIYTQAKKLGLVAIVDGLDEKKFLSSWLKLFEGGTLESSIIKVKLKRSLAGPTLRVVKFESDDLREIHTI